jgi:hypothetical protein
MSSVRESDKKNYKKFASRHLHPNGETRPQNRSICIMTWLMLLSPMTLSNVPLLNLIGSGGFRLAMVENGHFLYFTPQYTANNSVWCATVPTRDDQLQPRNPRAVS